MHMKVRTIVAAAAIGVTGITGIAVVGPALLSASASTSADTASPSPAPSAQPDQTKPSGQRLERIKDALVDLVSTGTITQAQADAVAQALAESKALHPHRPGFAGPGARGLHAGPGVVLDAAAKALGITTDELRTALREGDTLADVAKSRGVTVDTLVDALVKAATARVDAAVADGRLTSDQADTIKAHLRERITDLVNEDLPGHGMFGPGQRHGMFGSDHRHGMGPGADAVRPSA